VCVLLVHFRQVCMSSLVALWDVFYLLSFSLDEAANNSSVHWMNRCQRVLQHYGHVSDLIIKCGKFLYH